jgi:hypothetical protein
MRWQAQNVAMISVLGGLVAAIVNVHLAISALGSGHRITKLSPTVMAEGINVCDLADKDDCLLFVSYLSLGGACYCTSFAVTKSPLGARLPK